MQATPAYLSRLDASPRKNVISMVPAWSAAEVMRTTARNEDGKLASVGIPGYLIRRPGQRPGSAINQSHLNTSMRLAEQQTHARMGKQQPTLRPMPVMGYAMPPREAYPPPFMQPSVYESSLHPVSPRSPRGRPVSARMRPPPKQLYSPRFPAPKIVPKKEPKLPDPEPEKKVEKKVEVVAPKKRGWGELPPGVTPADLQKMQNMLREKLIDKYGNLMNAFRGFDKDGTGTVDRDELNKMLETLNLHLGAKQELIDVLFELTDADQSGTFEFKEFQRAMNSADIMNMVEVKVQVDGHEEARKKAEAADLAARTHQAALVGMSLEEYEAYWAPTNALFKQMTSEDMALKLDRRG